MRSALFFGFFMISRLTPEWWLVAIGFVLATMDLVDFALNLARGDKA